MVTTFRGRLTLVLAASTAAFLSIFCLILYLWCRSAFLADQDGDLEAILRSDLAASGDLETRLRMARPLSGAPGSYHVFGLIVSPDGTVLKSTDGAVSSSPTISSDELNRMVESGPLFSYLDYRGESYRVLGGPLTLDGKTLVEVLGISRGPVEESLRDLRRVLGLSLFLGIALLALISNRVARYLTRPLESILLQLGSVTSSGDPGMRLTGSYRDLEISSLQAQINAMLGRLDRSFKAQRRFVSDASHELRSPLSNLTLALDVCLRRERAPEDYREVLETCRGETRRLTEMANSLLTLSQSDEGGLVLRKDRVDLVQLLTNCSERHRVRAAQSKVRLALRADPLWGVVDADKLAQVLDNLVDNALRFAPANSTVELTARRTAEGAELRVTDHGQGLSQEQCQQLFERFYRVDASRQRGTGGAGLGLAIARVIVEAHGGTLGVESGQGQTAFWLTVPLEDPGATHASRR